MSPAEHYTYQFYSWEYRGRGWLLYDEAVHLEAPFIPFFRHGARYQQIDDGKRPSLFGSIFKAKQPAIYHDRESLDYENIDPFPYEREGNLGILKIHLPKDKVFSAEKMRAFLSMLSFTYSMISFEIIGDENSIAIQLVSDRKLTTSIETYAKAYFPDCSFVVTDVDTEQILVSDKRTMLIDFGLTQEFIRPIATNSKGSFSCLVSIIAALEALREGESGGIQILFQQTVNHWQDSIKRSVTMYDGSSFFQDDPKAPELALQKSDSLLYGVTIRAFGQAATDDEAMRIVEHLSHALVTASQSPTNSIAPLSTSSYDFVTRADDILLRESHRLGMLLSMNELMTFVRLPSERLYSKKLFATLRKTKRLPEKAMGKEYIIGENEHAGISEMVSISAEDRFKHTHIIGATGTGKSTLLANMLLQDIEAGNATILFDPHGDLAEDIIAHIPDQHLNNIVLIDPSDSDFPIGLNILEAKSDTEKEVLASDLVASFRRFATSWGDQMSGVLGNAILALLESPLPASLHELRRFLIEKEFRTQILATVKDQAVLYYWEKEFPLQKTNAIGPILIRLDTFLRPKSIRNIVVQRSGIDFERLLEEGKTIIVRLPQGLIGKENAYLLGSLILSKLHQLFFRRQQSHNRAPVFLYLDEFHHFITPSITEMLSGVRKYNVGLTLAHQDLQQLQRQDADVLNSVLNNAYTRIVFRVGEQDARKLQDGFSSFDATDLQNLSRGEAIVRIEQPQFNCSLTTLALPSIPPEVREANFSIVREYVRATYATFKDKVEEELFTSFSETENRPEAPKKTAAEPKPYTPKREEPILHTQRTEPIESKDIKHDTEEKSHESAHRYLQTLIKKVAESKGFVTTLESNLPDGSGKVDVLLRKVSKTYAIEICVTTNDAWECHNIKKCITAKYTQVVSVCGDIKQLERIKRACLDQGIGTGVLFFTPDALFQYLEETSTPASSEEPQQTMKGYRVNVTYEPQSQEEMERKRSLVAKVIGDSLKRRKK